MNISIVNGCVFFYSRFEFHNDNRKAIDINDDAFKGIEAMISSMTPQERSNPDLLDKSQSRRERIAKGCGLPLTEVNRMLKQFAETRKVMKGVAGAKFPQMPGKMRLK